jgi:F-type H+-transporting ATPase subunit epsilon
VPDYTPYPVRIVTPEGSAFDDEAQIVVLPGVAGELGVLANHAPLIAALRAGEIHLTDAGGQRHRWATDHGFLQVRKNRALVLVGAAVPADEVDLQAAEERLERAQERLERAREGDGDVYRAERELRDAENMVRIGRGRDQSGRVSSPG